MGVSWCVYCCNMLLLLHDHVCNCNFCAATIASVLEEEERATRAALPEDSDESDEEEEPVNINNTTITIFLHRYIIHVRSLLPPTGSR